MRSSQLYVVPCLAMLSAGATAVQASLPLSATGAFGGAPCPLAVRLELDTGEVYEVAAAVAAPWRGQRVRIEGHAGAPTLCGSALRYIPSRIDPAPSIALVQVEVPAAQWAPLANDLARILVRHPNARAVVTLVGASAIAELVQFTDRLYELAPAVAQVTTATWRPASANPGWYLQVGPRRQEVTNAQDLDRLLAAPR
jgi:hypothetical protein